QVRPVLARSAATKYFFVLAPSSTQAVEEDVAVVHLFARGNAAGLGIAGVVEPAAVGQPGDTGCAGVRDLVGGEMLAGVHVQHAQGTELGSAFRKPIRHLPTVP